MRVKDCISNCGLNGENQANGKVPFGQCSLTSGRTDGQECPGGSEVIVYTVSQALGRQGAGGA